MRRTTLSGLSPAQVNSRNGLMRGTHEHGTVKRQAAGQGSRPSLGMNRRQSLNNRTSDANTRNPGVRPSLYGMVKGSQSKSDNRPISSKQFQQNCILQLLNYLGEHGYGHPLSHKLLASPTSKDFFNIAQFLFKKVDPNSKITKVEDELPALFKQLGYQFPISKSALSAVGSPHTWPGLLAALSWLVELLQYEEKAIECKQGGSLDDNVMQKEFDDYVGKVYQYFLEGDDENCNLLDQEQEQRFAAMEDELRDMLADLLNENEAAQKDIGARRAAPTSKEVTLKQLSEIEIDIENLDAIISDSEIKKQDLETTLVEQKGMLPAILTELEQVQRDEAALGEKVAIQQTNQAALERLNEERNRLKESVQLATSKREALQTTVWNCEVQVSKKLEELEEAVKLYRASGERLALIPASARRAGGIVFDINLSIRGTTPEEMLGSHLKADVKPALQRLAADYEGEIAELQQSLRTLQEQLAESQALKMDEQNAIHLLEMRLKEVEFDYAKEKETAETERAAYEAEIEGVTFDVDQRLSKVNQLLQEYEERFQGTLAEYRKLETECTRDAELLESHLTSSMDILRKHKTHVERALGGLHSAIAEVSIDIGFQHN